MVVSTHTLPLPFPESGFKTETGRPDLSGYFAYQAPAAAPRSFSSRLDYALQSRQADPAPPARSSELGSPNAPESADSTSNADDAQNVDSQDEALANDRRAKLRSQSQAAFVVPALAGGQNPAAQTAAIPAPPAAPLAAAANLPPTPNLTANLAPQTSVLPTQTAPQPPALPIQNTLSATQNPNNADAKTTQTQNVPASGAVPISNLATVPAPPIEATAPAVAAPNSSGNPVDSRLAPTVATPGTESASQPHEISPAAAPLSALLSVAKPTAANEKTDAPQIVIAQNAAPAKKDVSVPVINVTATNSAPVPEPTAPSASAKPTVAATDDHLARLRTVGETAKPTPAVGAKTETVPAVNPAGEKPAEVPVNAPPSAALDKPTVNPQNADPVSNASPANNSAPLNSPFDSSANPGGAFVSAASPLASAAPPAGFFTSALPASPNHLTVGTNQSVSAAQVISGAAVVRQAQTNPGGDSRQEDHPASDREISALAAVKAGASSPELLVAANGTGSVRAASETAVVPLDTANAPIDRTKLLAQVSQHLETLRFAEGRGEAAFNLNPDHLGSLRIAISAHADGVTARIVAEHAGVRQVLESASEHLRTALENRGLKLHSLDITTASGNLADGRTAGNAQQQRDAWQNQNTFGRGAVRSNRIASNAVETSPAIPSAASAVSSKSNSRLDYRA